MGEEGQFALFVGEVALIKMHNTSLIAETA
jgi:hypothetical protein